MRLYKLIESTVENIEEFEDMDISDALYILAEMAEDGKLSEKEESIIEEMLERIFDEEDDEIEMEEVSSEELDEAEISTHADTAEERLSHFEKASMEERIKNRIYQRRYRRQSDVKMKAKKKAAVQKRCGKNKTAQLVKKGSLTFACKLKNRFRSKLMKRVMQRYAK